MFCPNCGTEFNKNKGFHFCKHCGSTLEFRTEKSEERSHSKRWPIILVSLLVLIPLISALIFYSTRYNSERLFNKYDNSIVLINTYDNKGNELGFGSGIVVSDDGLILTNSHVLQDSDSAIVKLPSGAFYPVTEYVMNDPFYDIATIKIEAKGLRAIKQYDIEDDISIGEKVYCIGNPRGFENTISHGIVSSLRGDDYYQMIQITAPISLGSSGGAMFNDKGELIGVTALLFTEGQNLNFAIPIKYALYQIYSHNFLNNITPTISKHEIWKYLENDENTLMPLAKAVGDSNISLEEEINNVMMRRGISRDAALRRLSRNKDIQETVATHLEALDSLQQRVNIHDLIVKKYNKMYSK